MCLIQFSHLVSPVVLSFPYAIVYQISTRVPPHIHKIVFAVELSQLYLSTANIVGTLFTNRCFSLWAPLLQRRCSFFPSFPSVAWNPKSPFCPSFWREPWTRLLLLHPLSLFMTLVGRHDLQSSGYFRHDASIAISVPRRSIHTSALSFCCQSTHTFYKVPWSEHSYSSSPDFFFFIDHSRHW